MAIAALFAAFTLISNLQAQPLLTIDTVTVGDAGNAADTTTYGAVADVFVIGKYEVTIGQYTSFLNAVAATDTYSLYNPSMATDLNIAGITQAGSSGSFSYSVIGSGSRPISYVSWFDAARFANWMNNGATVGASTETGAYTLNGATSGVNFTKNAGATWWIPSEDEWYKAAYYKGGGTNAGYWKYPTQSDSAPGNVVGGAANQANYNNGVYSVTQLGTYPELNSLTDAGAFSNSASAYGTFDQGGNVWEWNGTVIDSFRGLRGGSWSGPDAGLQSSGRSFDLTGEYYDVGFRVASVPEPLVLGISEAGTATFSGNIVNNNEATFTAASGGTATFSGIVSGAGTLNKTGAGTVTLSGASANTFTGMTTVSAGTLQLDKTAGTDALAGDVTVNSGAVLLISASNQVNDSSAVSLSGGTITRGSGVSEVFGALTLNDDSFLDFGTGTAGTLSFGTYTHTPSALLTINNFLPGNTLTFGWNLTDDINNSALFSFDNGFNSSWNSGTSTFTITAIPEPSTYLAAAGLLSLMLWPSRKRLLKDAKKIFGMTPPMRDRLAAKRA